MYIGRAWDDGVVVVTPGRSGVGVLTLGIGGVVVDMGGCGMTGVVVVTPGRSGIGFLTLGIEGVGMVITVNGSAPCCTSDVSQSRSCAIAKITKTGKKKIARFMSGECCKT